LRVSIEWLADYVDLSVNARELAELLTDSGTAVDGIEDIGGGLEHMVAGRVLDVRPHPTADRLSVCRVDLGGDTADIVCGAPNVKPGICAPVALPGSVLPDGTSVDKAVIRGVESRGMMLSERELGISDDAAVIMLLEEGVEAGASICEVLRLRDTVLVLEVTPNRPDCLCMLGVAREVAALTGKSLKMPSFELKEQGVAAAERVSVDIIDGDLCSRYAAKVIDGLAIGTSPWWIRRRLLAAGIRPINSVVDATNYVMLELGQPLHAFDYDRVVDGHILVRRAKTGERMTTLDGVERSLSAGDLLICDPSGPIALAGVMGGEDTEVSENTARVLLESAHFDPPSIMRTAKTQDLPSEASYRFERGVDPGGCVYAADRAAFIMQEFADGSVGPGVVDARARIIEPLRLGLRVARCGRLIGVSLQAEETAVLLRSIGLEVKGIRAGESGEEIEVEVPTFRPDLEREIDLVEEVARLYGYGRIPSTLPRTSSNIASPQPEQGARREIMRTMAGMGLHEAVTLAFISPRWPAMLDPARDYLPADEIRLRNPVSEEMSLMRPSLLPGLLEAVRFNLNRRVLDVHLFEIGRVFRRQAGERLPAESIMLGCALCGNWLPKQWGREAEAADFFTAKGILECLTASLHLECWHLRRESLPFLHPAQSCVVTIDDEDAGYMGLLHPRVAEEADLPAGIAVMEISVDPLVLAVQKQAPYEDIPRFPSIQMDLAVVVAEEVDCMDVENEIRDAGGGLLREVRLFDLYRGEQTGPGEKSLAYNLTFYAMDRTLRDEEVRTSYENIVNSLSGKFEARLR
jgi:phenylalanyl-tRNA synthetase beta chain